MGGTGKMSKGGLYFSIDDKLMDEKISLNNVSLPILKDFIEQVSIFIRGNESVDLNGVKIAIKPGSVAIVVEETPLIKTAISEYRIIKSSGDLGKISPVRAKVIANLQEKVRKNPSRLYTISDNIESAFIDQNSIKISLDSSYKIVHADQWVDTEAYLYGRVFNMGGKSKSNVHITLSNGTNIKLDTNEDILADDNKNRLYKEQLVRVKAQRNLRTKELRNERLVSFEYYEPHFNEDEFIKQVARTKLAWKDIPDIVSWVEEVRGNHAKTT